MACAQLVQFGHISTRSHEKEKGRERLSRCPPPKGTSSRAEASIARPGIAAAGLRVTCLVWRFCQPTAVVFSISRVFALTSASLIVGLILSLHPLLHMQFPSEAWDRRDSLLLSSRRWRSTVKMSLQLDIANVDRLEGSVFLYFFVGVVAWVVVKSVGNRQVQKRKIIGS